MMKKFRIKTYRSIAIASIHGARLEHFDITNGWSIRHEGIYPTIGDGLGILYMILGLWENLGNNIVFSIRNLKVLYFIAYSIFEVLRKSFEPQSFIQLPLFRMKKYGFPLGYFWLIFSQFNFLKPGFIQDPKSYPI